MNTNAGELGGGGGAVTYTACMIKCFKIIKKVDFISMLLVIIQYIVLAFKNISKSKTHKYIFIVNF